MGPGRGQDSSRRAVQSLMDGSQVYIARFKSNQRSIPNFGASLPDYVPDRCQHAIRYFWAAATTVGTEDLGCPVSVPQAREVILVFPIRQYEEMRDWCGQN